MPLLLAYSLRSLRVRKLTAGREQLVARERQYLRQLDSSPAEGEIELF